MNHLVGAGSLAGDAVMATPYRDPVTFTASKSRPHTKSFPERPKPRLPGSAPSKIRTCDLLLKRHSRPSAVLTCESTGQPGAKAQNGSRFLRRSSNVVNRACQAREHSARIPYPVGR